MPNSLAALLSKAQSIGPEQPNLNQPPTDTRSPLTAKSIPELLARYGLDPTDLGNVGGGIGHASIVMPETEGLAATLKPMIHGGIERGKELAFQLMERATGAIDNINGPIKPYEQQLHHKLMTFEPSPIDIEKILAQSKAVGARPPAATAVSVPEEFGFFHKNAGNSNFVSKRPLPVKRDPNLSALDSVWEKSESMAPKVPVSRRLDQPPISSTTKEPPKLLGRWHTKSNNRNQIRSLVADRNKLKED